MSLVIRITDAGKIYYTGSIPPLSKDGHSSEGRIMQLLMVREAKMLYLCAARALGEKFQRNRKSCEELAKAFEDVHKVDFKGDASTAIYLDSRANVHDVVTPLKAERRLTDYILLLEVFLKGLHEMSDSEIEKLTDDFVKGDVPEANKSLVYKVAEAALIKGGKPLS